MTCTDCQKELPADGIIAGRCHRCTHAALGRARVMLTEVTATLRGIHAAKRTEAERVRQYRDAILQRITNT